MRWLFAVLLVIAPHAVLAQTGTPEGIKQAEVLATTAFELFEKGEMLAAARKFLEAYELSGRHTQLRNAAKAFESAGQLTPAIDAWDRYAQHPDVDADKRQQATARVAELRAQLALTPLDSAAPQYPDLAPLSRPADPVEPMAPLLVAPREESSGSTLLGWSMVAGGGAAMVGGAVLYAVGQSTWGRWNSNNNSVTRSEADTAEVQRPIGLALGSVGVAVVAAALLFAFPDE